MKKTLIILHCLFSLNTLSYASFPITESSSLDISNAISFQIDEDDNEPSLIQYILRGVLFFSIVGFGLYFLIRAWWRSWRDDIRWVKILTYILLAFALLILLLSLIFLIFLPGGFGFSGG
jgi:hypothetical protein